MFQNIVISGSGKSIPNKVIDENYFKDYSFYTDKQERVEQTGVESAKKLETITGIKRRRYAEDHLVTSELATEASEKAIADAGIDKENIDQIIVAQNFGDIPFGSKQPDSLPSVASKVKHKLQIENPNCVAYDLVFGCPGWLQGVIHAYSFIKSGMAKTCLVIGAETLSRVTDPHDRDSMIYADGAGATIIQLKEEQKERGILSVAAQTYAKDEAYYLYSGKTYHPDKDDQTLYIKMHGRKIYEFAVTKVPQAMKQCIDATDKSIDELKKVFIHQANEKMDEAMIKRLYRLYKQPVPEGILPMSIYDLGNSSVATIPTLYDMVIHGEIDNHRVSDGDFVLFASVGAGMNINAVSYVI